MNAEQIMSKYPSIDHSYANDYRKIFDFLTDRSKFGPAIDALEQDVQGKVASAAGFERYLDWREKRLGFRAKAILSRSQAHANSHIPAPSEVSVPVVPHADDAQLRDRDFLILVGLGMPLQDVTFSDGDHGAITHRVQWILIDQHFGRSRELGHRLIQLYCYLGTTRAMRPVAIEDLNGPWHNLWFDLLDRVNFGDATCPEWLKKHIDSRGGKLGFWMW